MDGKGPGESAVNDNYFGKLPHPDISEYNRSSYAPKFVSPVELEK
jgi:hypothetical protein